MRSSLKHWPSPAMAVALVALFVALGGSASALVVVTSKNIKNGTIRGKDIHRRTITSARIKRNSLNGSVINESSLGQVPVAGAVSRVDRQARTISLGGGGIQSVTATCISGMSATGGGAKLSNPANDFVTGTYPAGRNGWTAEGAPGLGTPGTLTAYVMCAPARAATP